MPPRSNDREAGGRRNKPNSQSVEQLALVLEEDIVRRQLRVGDSYMTADEAGRMLGVSRSKAHRAFQRLAERKLLVSHKRRGTFVGPAGPFKPPAAHELRCVHAVLDPKRLRAGLSTGDLVDGLREALPNFDVQLNYLPSQESLAYVEQLYREQASPELSGRSAMSGVILFGAPREIQEYVQRQQLPAVIFGSVYPTTEQMARISIDNFSKGRLLAEHLLVRGHRRIGLFMAETWLPGDRLVYEGVNQVLAEAQLPHGTLELRNLSFDVGVIRAELRNLFELTSAPTALICQHWLVEVLVRELESLGIRVPSDVLVAIENSDVKSEAAARCPHLEPKVPFRQRVRHAGKMLEQLMAGNLPDPRQELISVRLVVPDFVAAAADPQVSDSSATEDVASTSSARENP